MPYTLIDTAPIQLQKNAAGDSASGYYLKLYAAGTTTPISMYTTSAGGGALAKCQIDSEGFTINGSGDPFIPSVDQSYKMVVYTNSTDADANTFASAFLALDNIPQISASSNYGDKPYDLTEAEFKAASYLVAGDVVTLSDRAGGTFDIASGTSGANGFDIIANTAATLKATLRLDNGNTSFRALGAVGDGATDTDALLARADDLLSDGATIYGHPDDGYLISGIQQIYKAITIDMQGGTISAAPSNSAIAFYGNGAIKNATMDNVWAGWDGAGVTYGHCFNCEFINQTYTPTTAVGGASNVVVEQCRFIGQPSGGSYVSFQVTTNSPGCKFLNNYCYDVKGGCNVNNSTHFVMSGNYIDGVTQNGIKFYESEGGTVENNYFANVDLYATFYDTAGTNQTNGTQLIVRNNMYYNVHQCLRNVAATTQGIRVLFDGNYMEECDWGVMRSVGHTIITNNHFFNGGALYYCGLSDASTFTNCSWDLTIENNYINTTTALSEGTCSDSIEIKGAIIVGAITDTTYKSAITIRNNYIQDYHTNGILVGSIGAYHPRVTITDNKFDAGANSVNHIVIGASRDLVVTRNREITACTGDELRYIRLDRNVGFPQVYENDWQYTTASPTTDTHLLGTKYTHSAPASAGYIGFVCVFAFGTTLSAGEPSGETSMAVAAGTGTANGDIVGVVQDDGTIHWTTVSSGGGTTTIVLTSGLTDDAASGNRVYFHRWKGYGVIA